MVRAGLPPCLPATPPNRIQRRKPLEQSERDEDCHLVIFHIQILGLRPNFLGTEGMAYTKMPAGMDSGAPSLAPTYMKERNPAKGTILVSGKHHSIELILSQIPAQHERRSLLSYSSRYPMLVKIGTLLTSKGSSVIQLLPSQSQVVRLSFMAFFWLCSRSRK